MKNDERIVRNILESFKDKLVSKKHLEKTFRNVLQDKYSKNIIVNIRQNKDILHVFKGYYYILNSKEKEGSYTDYSTNEMVYVILNKTNIKWYLGLYSALERNNIIWQGVVNPIIVNSRFSGEKKIFGVKYQFHKMKRELFDFGHIKKITKNRIAFYYSDPEKTYIDFVYFNKNPPSELSAFKNNEKLRSYLKNYSKNFKKRVLYP
jgi:predicted transcriptional regulator of viral defense system